MKRFGLLRRPLVLETERFRLVSLTRGQATRASHPWSGDTEVMAGFNERAGKVKRRRWRRRYRRFDDVHNICFGIWPKEGGGMIGIHSINMPESRDNASLMVMIGDHAWWGKKVVEEVRGFLVDWLFRTTPVHRVSGMTHSRNFSSIFNYKRLGFTYEGALRELYPGIAGGRVDMILFSLLRPEWEALRKADGGNAP